MQLQLCLKPLIFNHHLYGIYPSIKAKARHHIFIRHVDMRAIPDAVLVQPG